VGKGEGSTKFRGGVGHFHFGFSFFGHRTLSRDTTHAQQREMWPDDFVETLFSSTIGKLR
jgi:hypothetical protein